jgi:hypothetical protein
VDDYASGEVSDVDRGCDRGSGFYVFSVFPEMLVEMHLVVRLFDDILARLLFCGVRAPVLIIKGIAAARCVCP